jgi:hypothetical protein
MEHTVDVKVKVDDETTLNIQKIIVTTFLCMSVLSLVQQVGLVGGRVVSDISWRRTAKAIR